MQYLVMGAARQRSADPGLLSVGLIRLGPENRRTFSGAAWPPASSQPIPSR